MPSMARRAGSPAPAIGPGTAALPQGWNNDGLRLSTSGSRLFFVYDGNIYPEQPSHRTAIRYQWTRLMRALGADTRWKPSLAVTASDGCDAERLTLGGAGDDRVWLAASRSNGIEPA
jgi:hypothetical protein